MNLPAHEWAKVEKWALKELESVRVKNDSCGLSEEETAAYRGEIRLLKRILDLPNRATREVAAPPTSY
jgi:hypothetical protein